jgi:hypothetical protein
MIEHPQNGWTPPKPLKREEQLPVEQRAGADLLRQLEPFEPLSDIAVARIRRRLDVEAASDGRWRLPRWLMVVAFAATFLLFVETAAAALLAVSPTWRARIAAILLGSRGQGSSKRESLPPSAMTGAPVLSPAPSPAPTESSAASKPADTVAPSDKGPRPPARIVAHRGHAEHAGPPSSAPASEEEAKQLATALEQLHVRHSPESALASFEAYSFQHPNGALRGEAVVGQVEALLALQRETEALALLDAMEREGFRGVPRAGDLRLLRAELLGRFGRCNEALPAFEDYLRPQSAEAQRERALIARASCRATLKDFDGSREDLRTYLYEFPQGPYAAQALRTIDQLP